VSDAHISIRNYVTVTAAYCLNREWSLAASVAYVMGCQALSGIAKDLTKMSAKSAVKVLVPTGDESGLFKWVAVLTGSKNALKGAGFFVGGLLLSALGFRGALLAMSAGVLLVLVVVLTLLPASIGQANKKSKFSGILSNSSGINRLSMARRTRPRLGQRSGIGARSGHGVDSDRAAPRLSSGGDDAGWTSAFSISM
jgi:hypothetical protein